MVLLMLLLFILVILVILYFSYFAYLKLTNTFSQSATNLQGKTVILTGGSSGIGYQTALNLASRGCKLIIADKIISNEIKNNLIEATDNKQIFLKFVDLSSFKSVRKFAAEINAEESHIDILIHNAGIFSSQKQTEDNLNEVLQVNFFSPVLLTHLLADLLIVSAPARIIFVASATAFWFNLSVEDLRRQFSKWHCFNTYSKSKLGVILATKYFSENLEKYGVTSYSLDPGDADTYLLEDAQENVRMVVNKYIFKFLWPIYGALIKTPFEASQTIIHVATAKDLGNANGEFFMECAPVKMSKFVYNKELQRKIMEETENIIGLNGYGKKSVH